MEWEIRLMDMTNSESDSTSDFVDIHVGGSLQFHTIFIHTVSSIDGLGMRVITTLLREYEHPRVRELHSDLVYNYE